RPPAERPEPGRLRAESRNPHRPGRGKNRSRESTDSRNTKATHLQSPRLRTRSRSSSRGGNAHGETRYGGTRRQTPHALRHVPPPPPPPPPTTPPPPAIPPAPSAMTSAPRSPGGRRSGQRK